MRNLAALGLGLVLALASGCVAAPGSAGGPGSPQAGTPMPSLGTPSLSPATQPWSPPPVPTVAGRDVYTVSRAIAERDAGTLGSTTIALGGYWSASGAAWSCPYPGREPADLELYCQDGAYGITERYESTMTVITNGNMTTSRAAAGPHLSPWVPPGLQDRLAPWTPIPPIPIVVLGHFDDSRAAACVPEVRGACRERFVIESILAFDPASAPSPTPSPSPTPFPSPAPSGLFAATDCAGDVPYSFVGWTTTGTLGATFSFEGHVWAVVARDVVPTGHWSELPDTPGHFSLPFGRRVCVGLDLAPGAMSLGVVLGTGYRLWDDGQRTSDDSFGPGSGDPTLPATPSFPPLPTPIPVLMRGDGLPDATMAIRDWSGDLKSARPATAAELAFPGASTGADRSAAAAILPSDPRSVLIVWAECGSDTSGTIVVANDRQTLLVQAAGRTDCLQPGARRGAVLIFGSTVPAAVTVVAGLMAP